MKSLKVLRTVALKVLSLYVAILLILSACGRENAPPIKVAPVNLTCPPDYTCKIGNWGMNYCTHDIDTSKPKFECGTEYVPSDLLDLTCPLDYTCKLGSWGVNYCIHNTDSAKPKFECGTDIVP